MPPFLILAAAGDEGRPAVIHADESAADVGPTRLGILLEPDQLPDQGQSLAAVFARPRDAAVAAVELAALPGHVPGPGALEIVRALVGRNVVPQPGPHLSSKGAVLVGEGQIHVVSWLSVTLQRTVYLDKLYRIKVGERYWAQKIYLKDLSIRSYASSRLDDSPSGSRALVTNHNFSPTGSHQRVRPLKMSDQVAAQIRRMIARGELVDGDWLPTEAELIRQFGVSRPTLREAFRLLEGDSLVTIQARAPGRRAGDPARPGRGGGAFRHGADACRHVHRRRLGCAADDRTGRDTATGRDRVRYPAGRA